MVRAQPLALAWGRFRVEVGSRPRGRVVTPSLRSRRAGHYGPGSTDSQPIIAAEGELASEKGWPNGVGRLSPKAVVRTSKKALSDGHGVAAHPLDYRRTGRGPRFDDRVCAM